MINLAAQSIVFFLVILPVFLISLTVHEYSHGWLAYKYGDNTAKIAGRLTLNPFKHISLIGTIIFPILIGFGWAKPIPVDFSALDNRKIRNVAAAGPISNILLALVSAGAFHFFNLSKIPLLREFLMLMVIFNFVLAFFNLLPIPPLDGGRIIYSLMGSYNSNYFRENLLRYDNYGFLVLVGFLVMGGVRITVLPLATFLYSLLGMPSIT